MPTPAAGHELGAFLRAHRALLKPQDVGLPTTSRRRNPGLRREEVAALSGVSIAWYTWLEQGRVTASRQVLESIGRVLRLDDSEVRHALRLAGYDEPDASAALGSSEGALQSVLDSWPASPAALLDRNFDLTAWNAAWSAVWGDPSALPADRRNLMWLVAADEHMRDVLGDTEWEPLAASVFRYFRAQTGLNLPDERTAELYSRLAVDAPELSHWWSCHSLDEPASRVVTVTPHGSAPIRVSMSSLRPMDAPSSLILLFTPVNGEDGARVSALVHRSPRSVRSATGVL
ncbi:helix-turn-helix transcriptional regulator [Streptomyces sp. SP18CS02]|uniref:helix-turn-helix transcriptional regulator n=1 Tax=Streptomyces sp. SP18CS02 TaxID=3002531 RepID=UPI002E76B7B2|nr:helix-turn-helix transcriptional regulator [Streptomyces sp. SP18CS02]MEE1754568.1 helix-turn-helix transcriptional regulator [Streptomyces sp. SP18CS02]